MSFLLALTGAMAFLQIYNRGLLYLKHGRLKTVICHTAMVLFPLIPALFAFVYPPRQLVLGTMCVLLFFISLDLHMRLTRHRLRSRKPPVETDVKRRKVRGWLRDTTGDLVIREYIPDQVKWTGPAITIAHISDLHVDKLRSDNLLAMVFETIRARRPDILLMTGDFTDAVEALDRLVPFLAMLEIPLGIWGSIGNHDYWSNPGAIQRKLESVGVRFPSINGDAIQVSKTHVLRLSRCDYPYPARWTGIESPSTENSLHIVLSHTPDNFIRLARHSAPLVFSGHLHGGQWRLPVIGSVVAPSFRDRLFDLGHYRKGDAHLFVTAGIGNVWISRRINCPAEILMVYLSAGGDWSFPASEKVLASPTRTES